MSPHHETAPGVIAMYAATSGRGASSALVGAAARQSRARHDGRGAYGVPKPCQCCLSRVTRGLLGNLVAPELLPEFRIRVVAPQTQEASHVQCSRDVSFGHGRRSRRQLSRMR